MKLLLPFLIALSSLAYSQGKPVSNPLLNSGIRTFWVAVMRPSSTHNTPSRQLLLAHDDYWRKAGSKDTLVLSSIVQGEGIAAVVVYQSVVRQLTEREARKVANRDPMVVSKHWTANTYLWAKSDGFYVNDSPRESAHYFLLLFQPGPEYRKRPKASTEDLEELAKINRVEVEQSHEMVRKGMLVASGTMTLPSSASDDCRQPLYDITTDNLGKPIVDRRDPCYHYPDNGFVADSRTVTHQGHRGPQKLMLLRASSLQEAEQVSHADPEVAAGRVTVQVYEWMTPLDSQ